MSLSILPILLIFVTMAVGWWIGDYNAAYQQLRQQRTDLENSGVQSSGPSRDQEELAQLATLELPQRRFRYHFQLGLATALATVLINSLSVTYLIGTSRWVKGGFAGIRVGRSVHGQE